MKSYISTTKQFTECVSGCHVSNSTNNLNHQCGSKSMLHYNTWEGVKPLWRKHITNNHFTKSCVKCAAVSYMSRNVPMSWPEYS